MRSKFNAGKRFAAFIFMLVLSAAGTIFYSDKILAAQSDGFGIKVVQLDEEDAREEIKSYKKHLGDSAAVSGDEWLKYSSDYFYNKMDDNEKKLYDRFERVCFNLLSSEDDAITSDEISYRTELITYGDLGFTEEEAVVLSWLFFYGEPQYYFLNSTVYTSKGAGADAVSFGVYNAFADGEIRSQYTKTVKDTFEQWSDEVKLLAEGYTENVDIYTEKAAHDITCQKLVYEKNDYDQSIAGPVFLGGKAVCAGYAKTYMMLCNAAGVDTLVITSSYHAWNISYVDDTWYLVDCTWDDSSNDSSRDCVYDYFNLSDYDMEKNDRLGAHLVESMWVEYKPGCGIKLSETPGSTSVTDKKTEPEEPTGSGISTEPAISDSQTEFKITYKLKGGVNSKNNPKSYKEGDEIILKTPSKAGYKFKGWYTEDGEKITRISENDKRDYVLTAKWKKISLKKVSVKNFKLNTKLLTIGKVSGAEGYKAVYSKNKNFSKSSVKSVSGQNTKIKLKSIKLNSKNKKYYVKVRAYAVDSTGKKIYGKYSKAFVIKA